MKKIMMVIGLMLATTFLHADDGFGCASGALTRTSKGKTQCLYMWAVKHGHIKPWWIMSVEDHSGVKYYTVCDMRGDGKVISRWDYDSINTEWCDCPKR